MKGTIKLLSAPCFTISRAGSAAIDMDSWIMYSAVDKKCRSTDLHCLVTCRKTFLMWKNRLSNCIEQVWGFGVIKENSLNILEENSVSAVWNNENEILGTTLYRAERDAETDRCGLEWMITGGGYSLVLNPTAIGIPYNSMSYKRSLLVFLSFLFEWTRKTKK